VYFAEFSNTCSCRYSILKQISSKDAPVCPMEETEWLIAVEVSCVPRKQVCPFQ
jgi:hypothetical protein